MTTERVVSEAVEAVTQHRIKRVEEQDGVDKAGPRLREMLRAETADWIPIALPHLRQSIEEEVRERVLSDEALEAGASILCDAERDIGMWYRPDFHRAIEAALSSASIGTGEKK